MPLDPSIFQYYAGLEQQRNAQLQESLGKSIETAFKAKESGIDLKKMAERGAYELNATGKTSEENLLALKTLGDLEGAKTQYAQDPLNPGTLKAVTTPNAYQLLVERTQGAQYQPQYRPLGQAPSATRVMAQETTMQPSTEHVDQMQLSEGIPAISEDQMNAVIPSLPNLPMTRYPAQDAMTPQQAQAAERSRSMMQAPAQEFPTPRGGLVNPIPETGLSKIKEMESSLKVQEEAAKNPIEAERAALKKGGELSAEAIQKSLDALKRSGNIQFGLDIAERLIPMSSSGLLETGASIGKGVFGVSDKQTQANTALGTLSGWLVSNVPRMEGPQGVADVDLYKVMAADVGNTRKPIGDRLASLKVLRELQAKYSANEKRSIGAAQEKINRFRYIGNAE